MPKVTSKGSSGSSEMNFGKNWADVVFNREGSAWDPGTDRGRSTGGGSRRPSLAAKRRFNIAKGEETKNTKLRNEMLEQMIKAQKQKDADRGVGRGGAGKADKRITYGGHPGGQGGFGLFGDAAQGIWHETDTRTGETTMPYAPDSGGFAPDQSTQGAQGNVMMKILQEKLAGMEAKNAPRDTNAPYNPGLNPNLKEGIALVPETGPANLHEGEAVISAPVVKKVMGGEYPNGTTGTPKKPRDYKQVILEGAKSYKDGTGDKEKQESLLETIIEELFSLQQPDADPADYQPGMTRESPGMQPSGIPGALGEAMAEGEQRMLGNQPQPVGPPTEDILAPEEAPFMGEDTDINQLMGDVTGQAPPQSGLPGGATESVGQAGERSFEMTGDPNEPVQQGSTGMSAADEQKKQLQSLNQQAQSMYTSAVTLAAYANERPNSPAAEYLRQQSQERMKSSKQLNMMYQQGMQAQQAVEQQEAEREAQQVAVEHDARARETQAKYESEDRTRKLEREDRGESTKQIASLAKSLAGLEGGDAEKTEDILNQLIMYYMQQGGGFQQGEEAAAGGV